MENPERAEAHVENIQNLLDPSKQLSVGSKLWASRQDRQERQEMHRNDSILDLTSSVSMTSFTPTPTELLRCQSQKLTDRSDGFKSYAKPLVLNHANQISTSDEKLMTEI